VLALGVVVALALAVAVTWAVARDDGRSPAARRVRGADRHVRPGRRTDRRPDADHDAVAERGPGLRVPAFGSTAQAAAWQRQYGTTGSQPWHLDAGLTALAFTSEHLGFAALSEDTSRREVGREACIGVGYERPDGRSSTAAVVHLARMGADAPREVAGDAGQHHDPDVSGVRVAVTSPLAAGGRITGADESLRVAVVDPGGRTLGQVTGIAAGGTSSPWSARVPFTPPTGTVVTVVVSTGGHLTEVERFAVTAIRVAGR
jgi:hypothetical protein